jgi:hypothetical protein
LGNVPNNKKSKAKPEVSFPLPPTYKIFEVGLEILKGLDF